MITIGTARAVADFSQGLAIATVQVAAPPHRVFEAVTSDEVKRWWVRPGVFDTREWKADVRRGGEWCISGVGGGKPYTIEGKFLDVDPPRTLVQTWILGGAESTITWALEPIDGGTRITLRQTELDNPPTCANTAIGWETSFEELARMLGQA
ncbi:MAG TPA: SRPBCC family protein [Candidatus Dormibacteraeota bacterium]|nr:SRPBCC family protein [Candidatus Dormibacteraeota bacterium]